MLNLLLEVSTLPSLVAINLVKKEIKFFKLSHDLARPPDFMVYQGMSPTYQVWWP